MRSSQAARSAFIQIVAPQLPRLSGTVCRSFAEDKRVSRISDRGPACAPLGVTSYRLCATSRENKCLQPFGDWRGACRRNRDGRGSGKKRLPSAYRRGSGSGGWVDALPKQRQAFIGLIVDPGGKARIATVIERSALVAGQHPPLALPDHVGDSCWGRRPIETKASRSPVQAKSSTVTGARFSPSAAQHRPAGRH